MRPASYVPALAWMAVILALSSDDFSGANTSALMGALLTRFLPWVTASHAGALHVLVRKVAHFTEFAILALVWYRALRADRTLTPRGAAWSALAISAAWAVIDEARQGFATSRSPDAMDAAVDMVGAAVAMLAVTRWPATLQALTTALLVLATAVGAVLLVMRLALGAHPGALWITVLAALLALLGWWRLRRAPARRLRP